MKTRKLSTSSSRRGFTLIELLVVIAIIGLLSTLAVVQLNSARGKARDARRLSDVKQLSTIIEMESTSGADTTAIAGCTAADALTTICSGPGQISQFLAANSDFEDPSTPATACTSASTATCGYSMSQANGAAAATLGNYQICFYLEQGAGSAPAGRNKITTGGQMSAGCN